MKVIFLSLLLFVPSRYFAQSQRLVLVEHFSNAGCGPCANQNPGLNTLLDNNTTKAIALKYAVSYPGTDPLNAQNPTDASARATYYGSPATPNTGVDGSNPSFTTLITQSRINTAYAVPAPFDLSVSHSLSSNFTSVTIQYTLTATQAFSTANPLVLHLVLTEKKIEFVNAPGSNGEKVFKDVMRKMVPSAAGTPLSGNWALGQTLTNSITVPVPSYYYDLNQLEVVAFIQENGTKAVHQAAKSVAQPLGLEAGVVGISDLPNLLCSSNISPKVSIVNLGANTLTTADIEVRIDTGTPTLVPWSGSLASGDTTLISIPGLPVSLGNHVFTATLININGSPDYLPANNVKTLDFTSFSSTLPVPMSEDFEASVFPPANWTLVDPASPTAWNKSPVITGTNGNTIAARAFKWFTSNNPVDDMFLPPAQLANNPNDTIILTFHVAYAEMNANSNHKIEVMASSDCGVNWVSMYSKAGANLASAPIFSAGNWEPQSATDWRIDTVDLSSLANTSTLLVKFSAFTSTFTSYGNPAYIDNVLLTRKAGIISALQAKERTTVQAQNYPNPASDFSILDLKDIPDHVEWVLTDLTGRTMLTQTIEPGNASIRIDTRSLHNGIYVYHVYQGQTILATGKMIVQH